MNRHHLPAWDDPIDGLRDIDPAIPVNDLSAELRRTNPPAYDGPPFPCCPTNALPGTQEKVQVMASRYAHGQQVFHPDDTRIAVRAAFVKTRTCGNGQVPLDLREMVEETAQEAGDDDGDADC